MKKPVEILPEDRVKLPAILGIRPGYYLTVLYGAAVLAVLFFILLYPGLSKPGSLGVFRSEPSGAAVRIDGVTLGYTPCEIFVPQGKHRTEFVLPGFTADVQETDAGGRLFASWFFPRRMAVSGKLSAPDPAGAFALSALEFIRWSGMGEPTRAFQFPLSLSEGAYRAGPAARDPAVYEAMNGILGASLRYAQNRNAVRDLLRSRFLVDNAGLSPSPFSLVRSLKDISARIGSGGAPAAAWLAEFLPAQALNGSGWAAETSPPDQEEPAFRPSSVTVEGAVFDSLPGGLMIARSPVSKTAWAAFTAENPRWAAENRDELAALGLAGKDYLVQPDHPAYPDPAAAGISWYAARAYCAWLGAKLPPSLSGREVRLPTEAEWEDAARRLSSRGLLWEWCSDAYAPLSFFPAAEQALDVLEKAAEDPAALGTPERSVRGGSWANPPESVDIKSRGSLPADTSSPFVGLRPVIAPKAGETVP